MASVLEEERQASLDLVRKIDEYERQLRQEESDAAKAFRELKRKEAFRAGMSSRVGFSSLFCHPTLTDPCELHTAAREMEPYKINRFHRLRLRDPVPLPYPVPRLVCTEVFELPLHAEARRAREARDHLASYQPVVVPVPSPGVGFATLFGRPQEALGPDFAPVPETTAAQQTVLPSAT